MVGIVGVARTLIADTLTLVNGAWTDVDVTAHVDPGNTAGVLLEIVSPIATTPDWGVRKNGSTDVIIGDMSISAHCWVAIGVDAANIFECYMNIAGGEKIDIYIIGYILNVHGSFFTNSIDKSITIAEAWMDIDISGDTGEDTALCAFLMVDLTNSGEHGFRENGSTDNQVGLTGVLRLSGAMMAVDENEVLEGYIEDLTTDFYLVGYLTDGIKSFANSIDYSTGILSPDWVDTDFSLDIPAHGEGAFVHFTNFVAPVAVYQGGIRKNGAAYENYFHLMRHAYLWVEMDENRMIEQEIENVNLDLYLWGYSGPIFKLPSDLLCEQKKNPTDVTDPQPEFSAVHRY